MKRVLLTGMSGVGKSSVIGELSTLGYKAVDTDYGGFSEMVAVPDDEPTGLGAGWDWVWREDRIHDLLDTEDADVLFVSGTSPNQGKFYPRFDRIIVLTAPEAEISARLRTRTNNPYGNRPEEISRVMDLIKTIEPILKKGADHIVATDAPLARVVDEVLRLSGER